MPGKELGQHGQGITRPGIVFHCAGTQRIKLGVYGKILLRQSRVVAHRIHFGNFRQQRRRFTKQIGRNASRIGWFRWRLGVVAAARTGVFKYQHVKSEFVWRLISRVKGFLDSLFARFLQITCWLQACICYKVAPFFLPAGAGQENCKRES